MIAPGRVVDQFGEGDGVRAVEDPEVTATLAERGIACEVCPTSNVALGVATGLHAVPLQTLEEAGVPVVLAADDPLLFGAGLVDQYAAVRDALGYSRSDLARLAKSSVTHSLMPTELGSRVMSEIDRWATGIGEGMADDAVGHAPTTATSG